MANVRGFWMGSENCNQFCAAVSRCMAKRTIIDGPVLSKVWINVVALQLLFDLLKNVNTSATFSSVSCTADVLKTPAVPCVPATVGWHSSRHLLRWQSQAANTRPKQEQTSGAFLSSKKWGGLSQKKTQRRPSGFNWSSWSIVLPVTSLSPNQNIIGEPLLGCGPL